MFPTSRFFIGCMKWQHAVILESICETDSIRIFFPAQRTGVLTPLLTCFTLLSFSLLLREIILSPTPFLPFAFSKSNFSSFFPSDKNILSPTSIPQKYSKFCLSRKIISISQNYSKSPSLSDLGKIPLFAYTFHSLAAGV